MLDDVAHYCGCGELVWLTECFMRENVNKLHWTAMMDSINVRAILHHAWKAKVERNKKQIAHIAMYSGDVQYIFDPENMNISVF